MNHENHTSDELNGTLYRHLHRLIQEVDQTFSNSRHQLTILTHTQEELDIIASDFSTSAFMNLTVFPESIFQSNATEQIYRQLKGELTFPVQYWENDLRKELQEFCTKIETLEMLSQLYASHLSECHPDLKLELTFVVSDPESPLMAIYSGRKAMVYQFSK